MFQYFDPQQLHSVREYVDSCKKDKSYAERKKKEAEENLNRTKLRAEAIEKARVLIQLAAQKTQQNLIYHISAPVTAAIRSVLPDNINYIARIETRRNKTECDLLFEEDGNEYKPLKGSGFGAVNVAAFVERICFWSLKKNRKSFLLDEPFRDVSPDFQYKVSNMVKELCTRLGIQILMVSHAEDINMAADKTFVVSKKKGISEVKEIN